MRIRLRTRWVLAIGLGVTAATSAGANLLTNGSFDGGLDGWTTNISAPGIELGLFWNEATDRTGTPGSSAGIMQNASSQPGSSGTVPLQDDACFPVTPSDVVRTNGWVLLPTPQERTGEAGISVGFYANPDCTSFLGYGFPEDDVSVQDGQWHAIADERVPPAGAQSMRLGIILRKTEAGGSLTAWFDDLVVTAPEPMASAGGSAALAGLGGIAARRRSRRSTPRRGR